jgi:hypothetical protein
MKKTIYAFLIGSVVSMSLPALAVDGGLFVEPALTYESSSSSIDYGAPLNNSSGSVNGAGLGLRLGGHIMDIMFIGADVRYSRPQFKDSSNNYDATATSINYGVVVGAQMPVLGLRVWGGYVLGGELNPEASGGTDVKFADPKGYRIGAGIHVLMVSVNLEYQELKYDKTTIEQLGGVNTNTSISNKLQNNSYVVSVSFPMSL